MMNDEVPIENAESQESTMDSATAKFPSREELLQESSVANTEATEAPQTNNESAEHTEIEKEALSKGWVPLEDYKGEKEYWTNPKVFLENNKFFKRINEQGGEIKALQSANTQMLDLLKKQAKKATHDEAERILQNKRDAIAQGDVESVETYEKKYNEVQEEIREIESPANIQSQDGPASEEIAFARRNQSWFNKSTAENRAMVEYALDIDREFYKANPSMGIDERLQQVEERVKTFYRHRFENPNRNRAPTVESRTPHTKRDPGKITYADLPGDVKKIVDGLTGTGGSKLDRDKYAQILFKTGGVSND